MSRIRHLIQSIEKFLDEKGITFEELKKSYNYYQKQSKRFDKIIKQSDKQQKKLLNLNEELSEQESKIRELYEYDFSQQMIAKNKVEMNIVNELVDDNDFLVDIIFLASDILSGDFYSIYKDNDKIIYYVIDGQGHGISPALTVFSVSSIFIDSIKASNSLQELLDCMINYIKMSLLDEEQLSFTFIEIDLKTNILSYAIGGMYPTYVKLDEDELLKIKANNLPIMNFSDKVEVKSIDITGFKSIISYSDGIVENEISKKYHPKNLIKTPSLLDDLRVLDAKYKEDDITIVLINKKD